MMATSTAKAALQVWVHHEQSAQGNPGAVVINGTQAGRTGCETGRLAAG